MKTTNSNPLATLRPLTCSVTEGQKTMILCARPICVLENIVQAWDALDAFDRGEKQAQNLAFASNRYACANVDLVRCTDTGKGSRSVIRARREMVTLRAAIDERAKKSA